MNGGTGRGFPSIDHEKAATILHGLDRSMELKVAGARAPVASKVSQDALLMKG